MSEQERFAGLKVQRPQDMPGWGVCMAIYGAPGVGKTTFASDAQDSPFGTPVIFLDAESGIRSVGHRDDIDVIQITSFAQVSAFINALKQTSDARWRTIILDNMSEIQSLAIKAAQGDSEMPQIQHYGKATSDILQLTRTCRDIARLRSINFIMIVWESPEKDESTGIIKRDIGFSPSLAKTFPGLVDQVGYLTAADQPPYLRTLHFESSSRTAAKFRRSQSESATTIPLTFSYKIDDKPLVDLLATLVGEVAWPKDKYSTRPGR
jgi:phage nucleotide-binding protein